MLLGLVWKVPSASRRGQKEDLTFDVCLAKEKSCRPTISKPYL